MNNDDDHLCALVERFQAGDDSVRADLLASDVSIALTGLSLTLDAVALYHWLEFSIVPQLPGAKAPCLKWKPFQERRATTEECFHWWHAQWPDAGVAIVLGPVSNLFVVDVDGTAAHQELVRRLGKVPRAPKVKSGSGKKHRYHLFFRHPDLTTKAKATPWHPQLEFRGQGGIVIAPPSLHKSGKRYRWAQGRSLDDLAPPELPEAIVDALKLKVIPPRPATQPPGQLGQLVSIPLLPRLSWATQQYLKGRFANGPDWNRRLFTAACDMAGNGYQQDVAAPMLLAGAQPWNASEEEKAVTTIRSAFSEQREPARRGRDRKKAVTKTITIQVEVLHDEEKS
ncbi:MAG: bifunctional DNA primase/polymerase [Pirellulaceae bacterium]